MTPGKHNISIYQGDTFEMTVTLKDGADPEEVVPLSGWVAKAQMRAVGAEADADPELEFTCSIDGAEGKITVTASAEDTAGLTPGKYLYDLQISSGATVQTILRGSAVVTEEITKT
jgi:hypothetical protein